MTWVKLDDGFWSHPKILRIGNEAAGAFARALSYCGAHLTDGFVPGKAAKFIAAPRILQTLLDIGLVEEIEDGYLIPDFHEFNPTKAQVEEQRRQNAARQAKWRGGNG